MTEVTQAELAKIAEDNALAVVVVDENSDIVLSVNNNSICEVLSASDEFASSCAEFCGRAHQFAGEDRGSYRCFAGLDCIAVRLKTEKTLVAIVGRAFTSAENYRRATERAVSGDWNKFPPTKVFGNVLLTSSERNIRDATTKIGAFPVESPKTQVPEIAETVAESAVAVETADTPLLEIPSERATNAGSAVVTNDAEAQSMPIPKPAGEAPLSEQTDQKSTIDQMLREFQEKPAGIVAVSGPPSPESEELAAWRSFFGSLASLKYHDACVSILEFLQRRYGLASLGWLELRERGFEVTSATGKLENQHFRVTFDPRDRRLFQAIESATPLRLRERTITGEDTERRSVALYPIAVGDEVQNALVVADAVEDEYLTGHLSRFCHSVASEIEVLRLREEVRRRSWLAKAVDRFNSSLKDLDAEDFWSKFIQISAELMNSERSSLLLLDERTDKLSIRAALGSTAELIAESAEGLGERVARGVLTEGKPVVVGDVTKIGLGPAPDDWRYKTGSFICYPFVIGDRRVGVLNVADKADGTAYTQVDLDVLEAIAPQVAVVLDRAALRSKAGEFEQLSVTDPLTGLLNRRYLEERLAEEIKRSNRYGYPMSFLMIDVDDFGKFNKDFGVLVGDNVLREAVKAMKGTLRGADIAARYGGEEFCVLLPQTTLAEARTIAERIRHSVERIEFPQRPITISIGISAYGNGVATAEEIISAADEAMREAKAAGKNNVKVHDSAEFGGN